MEFYEDYTMAVVSEELCEARRQHFASSLQSIRKDIAETREGVGKMLRIVCYVL